VPQRIIDYWEKSKGKKHGLEGRATIVNSQLGEALNV
jgi:hypothetical protein